MEKIKSLPANYIFQAVDARQIGMMERFYRASEVDALLSDVRSLVEASKAYAEMTVKVLDGRSDKIEAMQVASNLKQATATVEKWMK